MTRLKANQHYGQFLASIKERIRQSQYEALKAVNKESIALYWDIGRMIVDRQKKHGWGKAIWSGPIMLSFCRSKMKKRANGWSGAFRFILPKAL